MTELIDRRLGQYHLKEIVRRGGMSTVYKAYQEALDRFVAIKVLSASPNPQFSARFKREARAMAALQHHNILPIYDVGEQDGLLYLVLQYVENGTTLGDLLGQPMQPTRALRLIAHVLDALDYAHKRGVIHRDIKPSNVLMPTSDWPMLADFGIAKLMEDTQERLTLANQIIGTAAYMAPEQATGRPVDARTDLYAAGVVLYELVTGRLPFDADTPMTVVTKHAYEPPPPPRSFNPDLSPLVETVLLKALAKGPAARYQTAAEMAKALNQMAAQLDQSRSQVTGLYQVGVRAFEERRWDVAVERLGQLLDLAPGYEDATELLAVAREAQERSQAELGQQIEMPRRPPQSTSHPQLQPAADSEPPPPPMPSTSAVVTGTSRDAGRPASPPSAPTTVQLPALADSREAPATRVLDKSSIPPAAQRAAELPTARLAATPDAPPQKPAAPAALTTQPIQLGVADDAAGVREPPVPARAVPAVLEQKPTAALVEPSAEQIAGSRRSPRLWLIAISTAVVLLVVLFLVLRPG